jgi:hypothetical protein
LRRQSPGIWSVVDAARFEFAEQLDQPLSARENRNSWGTASMSRKIIAFVAALITWALVATVFNRLLRIGLPGYEAAEPAMAFTLTMLWARLALGALASVTAGYVLARLAPNGGRLPLILGALVLAMFLPIHYSLWSRFPIWYHLLFLLTIVPFVMAGALIGARNATLRKVAT